MYIAVGGSVEERVLNLILVQLRFIFRILVVHWKLSVGTQCGTCDTKYDTPSVFSMVPISTQ